MQPFRWLITFCIVVVVGYAQVDYLFNNDHLTEGQRFWHYWPFWLTAGSGAVLLFVMEIYERLDRKTR